MAKGLGSCAAWNRLTLSIARSSARDLRAVSYFRGGGELLARDREDSSFTPSKRSV